MNRIQQTLALLAVVAVPVAAHSMLAPAKDRLCFSSGSSTYQIARDASAADFRVRIAADAQHADLKMRLVDRPEIADFVLVDDFSANEPAPCRSATPIRTVALDAQAPDVTVRLSADAAAADYKIYVHSIRFSQQDAAALLAAMWKADQRGEVTGSIAKR